MKSEMAPRSFAVRTRMTALWAIAIFVLAALPLSFGVGTAVAGTQEPTTQSQVLAVGASCFYLPAKAFYAVFGAATAGLAYGFTMGDDELANQIWTASVEGSYIVTPAMIEGREPVRFKGP